MFMMVDAVAWNFLLLLLLMLIIIWPKGLSSEQICSKSAETVCRVQKCPASQTEWDKAARRKDCSEIQKYDNCTKVEYHCLVNEFRNETIEVCTSRRLVQGHCPIYSENKAKNDYNKYCENQTPCNCSSVYNSTEAYKWQCCYNRTNINSKRIQNDQDNIKYNCGGNTNATDLDKDQSSNVPVAAWLVPALLLVLALYVLFVCYGKKRQNKSYSEALKVWDIWTQRSLDSRVNERNGIDDQGTTLLPQEVGTNPPAETQIDGSTQEPETPNGDSLDQGMSTSNTQEEIMSSNPETPLSDTSPRPFTPATPNEDSLIQASDTPNKAGPQPSTSASQIKEGEKNRSDLNFPVSQPSDNGSRAEDDVTVKPSSGLFPNPVSMAKDDDPLNTQKKEQTLDERMKHLEDLKKKLEERLKRILVGDIWFLDYKVRSTKQKMQKMKRISCGSIQKPKITLAQLKKKRDSHHQKVGMLEEILKKMLLATDEFECDYGNHENSITKPKQKKSTINYNVKDKENAVKSENKLAASNVINWIDNDAQGDTEHQKDYNTHAKEEEMPIRMPLFQPPMNPNKKAKETVFRMPDDDNGASVVKENLSAKDRIWELMINFENWRSAIQEGRSGIDNTEERLLEIEADIVILNRLFEFEIPGLENKTEEEGQQKASNVNNMEQTFEELNEMFDELEKNYK